MDFFDILNEPLLLSTFSSDFLLSLNISYTFTSFIVCAKLPSIPQNQISVNINQNVLPIRMSRRKE